MKYYSSSVLPVLCLIVSSLYWLYCICQTLALSWCEVAWWYVNLCFTRVMNGYSFSGIEFTRLPGCNGLPLLQHPLRVPVMVFDWLEWGGALRHRLREASAAAEAKFISSHALGMALLHTTRSHNNTVYGKIHTDSNTLIYKLSDAH